MLFNWQWLLFAAHLDPIWSLHSPDVLFYVLKSGLLLVFGCGGFCWGFLFVCLVVVGILVVFICLLVLCFVFPGSTGNSLCYSLIAFLFSIVLINSLITTTLYWLMTKMKMTIMLSLEMNSFWSQTNISTTCWWTQHTVISSSPPMSTTKVRACTGLYFLTTNRLLWKLPVIILGKKKRMGTGEKKNTWQKKGLKRYCSKAQSCLWCSPSLWQGLGIICSWKTFHDGQSSILGRQYSLLGFTCPIKDGVKTNCDVNLLAMVTLYKGPDLSMSLGVKYLIDFSWEFRHK